MRPWKIPALSQLKENQQQQKRNPRNCERVRSSSTKKILVCFVCLKRPGSWLSPTTACHTPAEIQGLSCLRLCCCCCGGSVETPKIFFGQGHITIMLKSGLTAPITAWHENSLERGCMAPILGGLTVFATFLTFLILLWKKTHQVSSMVSQRLWPCLLHGKPGTVYEFKLWKSALLRLQSLSVSTQTDADFPASGKGLRHHLKISKPLYNLIIAWPSRNS